MRQILLVVAAIALIDVVEAKERTQRYKPGDDVDVWGYKVRLVPGRNELISLTGRPRFCIKPDHAPKRDSLSAS